MFGWIIGIIVVGAIIGLFVNGKEGAAMGAMGGFAVILEIGKIVLPILIIVLLIRACN